MEGPRARGVSLWLMPGGDPGERLARLVARLAGRLSTAPFLPHLTLLPGIEGRSDDDVLARGRHLAAALRPVSVRLGAIEGRDEHFRCLFVRAEADEPLRAAHAAASQAFGRPADPAFLPHLSLVYGTLPPEARSALAAELAAEVEGSFEATRLHVWRTAGSVGEWREIGAYRLG